MAKNIGGGRKGAIIGATQYQMSSGRFIVINHNTRNIYTTKNKAKGVRMGKRK